MKKKIGLLHRISRMAVALLTTAALLFVSLGAGSSPFTVADTGEFLTALEDASHASGAQVIYLLDSSTVVDLSSGTYSIPSNVTVQLTSGTLRVSGATLYVSGTISGGALDVTGGTLVRSGGNITATISVSGSGTVRGARKLTLENLDSTSGESIVSISYEGESGSDTTAFVTNAATDTVYTKMTGSGFASYKVIESVITDAGHVFRLGTKNTDTLSLSYTITYSGLTGASLASLNPSSYTASDSAILLINPTRDGHVFDGWTCTALGVTKPTDHMVIPEGTTGELAFVANWSESTLMSRSGGTSGSGSASGATTAATETTATDDAATQQEAAASQDEAATSTKRVKTASSSTKVTFTSSVDTVLPTIESVEGNSFPWGWLFGGAAGLAVLLYLVALLQRKRRERKG
ncbi:MAG: hypothetical protein LLF75_01285 [Eubacteriales bacterium]|nr:hypothetical protein [Eubacteriales bacterium]